jgi:hypothetical protein
MPESLPIDEGHSPAAERRTCACGRRESAGMRHGGMTESSTTNSGVTGTAVRDCRRSECGTRRYCRESGQCDRH